MQIFIYWLICCVALILIHLKNDRSIHFCATKVLTWHNFSTNFYLNVNERNEKKKKDNATNDKLQNFNRQNHLHDVTLACVRASTCGVVTLQACKTLSLNLNIVNEWNHIYHKHLKWNTSKIWFNLWCFWSIWFLQSFCKIIKKNITTDTCFCKDQQWHVLQALHSKRP